MEKLGKILILEDDESVGAALRETLSRTGYEVELIVRPNDALTYLASVGKVDFIFVDCLLPQMTGVKFLHEVRQRFPSLNFKTVLMSGIYTDKQFIQESSKEVNAVAFLRKPFEVEHVLKIVEKTVEKKRKSAEVSARKILYQMFANPNMTSRQKRKAIESIEEVSGFDLPFLYSLLAETGSTGYLNIYSADGSVSGISFSNGHIVAVDIDDQSTFLGEMLIQSGFANPNEVHSALKNKNNRKIGSYLIQNNQLSPHAFDLILMEQMNIRLVKTIRDERIRINWAGSEVEMTSPNIDPDALATYLHDWIASKIAINWLKSFYVMWSSHVIVKSQDFTADNPALQMSLLKSLDGLYVRLSNQVSLSQLLEVKSYNELAVYKAIHFLLTKGLIVFTQRSSFSSPQEQLMVLKRVWTSFEGKKPIEIAAYLEDGADGSFEASVEDLVGLIGEEPEGTHADVYKMWHQIKNAIESAKALAGDSAQVSQYKAQTQKNDSELKMKSIGMMEELKKLLHFNQYGAAVQKVIEIQKVNPNAQYLNLYSAWAKLGVANDPAKKVAMIKDVEIELMQVPPDEKYDCVFPFVMGLLSKIKGDTLGARKSFEKSLALDQSFIPARRELSAAMVQKKNTSSLDLKQVVSGFFKKR